MFSTIILGVSMVILLCVISEKFSYKLGVPALIFFMFVGMLFGQDGLGIQYSDFTSAEMICSLGLIFIMFDGGFNTNWSTAKKTVKQAVTLSTFGVLLTAVFTTVCMHMLFHLPYGESFLIAAVLASTDAASVFSILKSNNLDLKDGTSPILEVESGSNDPMAYLLTITAISVMLTGQISVTNILLTIFVQLFIGSLMGILFAVGTRYVLQKKNVLSDGLELIFMIGVVLLCYAISDKFGGNAYLSVYLLGIYLGNTRMNAKRSIAAFFNGLTSLLQIMIFFIIGLLAVPSTMHKSLLLSLAVVFVLTFIARPLMSVILLMPQKCSFRQCMLISWAGLRGASSIVFAIVAVSSGISLSFDLFHVVFLVSLFSISIQGALLPTVSKKLDMIDEHPNIYKTFNELDESVDFQFTLVHINEDNSWKGKRVKDIDLPFGAQVIMIKRDGKSLAARGKSVIKENDDLLINVPAYYPSDKESVQQVNIYHKHPYADRTVEDLAIPNNQLIIMIIRGEEKIIPNGDTIVREGDTMLIFKGQ